MYYATSYHFTIMNNGVIKSTETWVFKEDTLENRRKTKDWFKKFVELSDIKYSGSCYSDFLTEVVGGSHKRLTDGILIIDVRNHK